MKRNAIKNVTIIGSLFFIAACSAKGLVKGAETVRVLPSQPASGCKYLGDVVGSQTGGSLNTSAKVAQGAINDLKNKVYKLGGNAVLIMDSKAAISGGGFDGTYLSSPSHTMMGIAYKCSSF